MRILGLDEAGRGCVIGSLFVGAYLYDGDQARLREAGATDSKLLSPAARATAHAALGPLGEGAVHAITAAEIDAGNVNRLEEAAFVTFAKRFRPDRVYLDAPVHPGGIKALTARLVRESGVEDWVVEPKADLTWPVVGAASILAKEAREQALATLAAAIAPALGPLGSGYPSDPETRAYLVRVMALAEPLPPWIRARWGTLEVLRQGRLF